MLNNPRRISHAEAIEILKRQHREAMARRQRQLEADFREWFESIGDCPKEPEACEKGKESK